MDEWEGRLRVGMFTNVYLPTTNGVVVSVETFRKALTRLGHDVFIFGPDVGDIVDRAPFIFRYPALELPMQKYPLTLPVSPFIDHLLKRNLKPHVLHANHPALLGRVAEKKSEELNLPLVFTYHTRYADYSHYAEPLPQDQVKEFIDQWLSVFMAKCHHIVVPSNSIRELLEKKHGMTEHVSVVPTGVELEKFSRYEKGEARELLGWDSGDKVLVSVGRLAKEKSFDLLLDAFSRLQDKSVRLVIIGSGDEARTLKRMAESLGVDERVEFTGLIPFDKVPLYLAASDFFAFASITETQGLVTLEALAAGCPVVAVDASGTREAVDDTCSVLTEHDAEALAVAIDEMMGRGDWGALSEAARKRAGEFGSLRQGEAMVEVYQKAMEAHKAGIHALPRKERVRQNWLEYLKAFKVWD